MKDKIKEWYKNNKYNIKRYLSYLVLFIIMVVLAIPFVIDLNRIDISKVPLLGHIVTPFLIDNEKIADMMSTLFEVQASVSTLGIALISILGGICKDTVFGISVTRYITQMKPNVLTHKFLVTSELVLIILGYVALSVDYYNWLIAIFFVSISMTIYMVYDIFFIFKGNSAIEDDIKDFYKDLFLKVNTKKSLQEKQSIIYDISQDIRVSVNENKYIDFEKDLDFVKELFAKHITSKSENVPYNKETDKVLKEFEQKIIEFSKEVFNKAEYNFVIKTIDFLIEIHKQCNDLNSEKKYIYLDIYDYIYKELFKSSYKTEKSLYNDLIHKLMILRNALYDNMFFKKDDLINNQRLINFSSSVQNTLLNNYNSMSKPINKLYSLQQFIYAYIKFEFSEDKNCSFRLFKEQKLNRSINELHLYTKTLIDNMQIETLNKTIFIDFKFPVMLSILYQYYFDILIYLYYLAECEDLVEENSKVIYKRDVIINNRRSFIGFFRKIPKSIYNNKITIKYFKNKYSGWERSSDTGMGLGKKFILDSVADKFVLYNILFQDNDLKSIKDSIGKIENEISLLDIITEKNETIFKEYQGFVRLFFNEEISKEQAEDKLQMLQQACEEIQKDDNKSDSIPT